MVYMLHIDRRYAVKKDSSSRLSTTNVVHAVARDEEFVNKSYGVAVPPMLNNAVAAYSGNGYNRNYNSNRYGNRGKGVVRQVSVPQWVIDYCRNNKLCFRCKEAFTADTHPPGRRCNRPIKRLDEKLRPQSN